MSENRTIKVVIVSILMMFSLSVVTAELQDAPSIYFDSDDVELDCGQSTTIPVRINTSVDRIAIQTFIDFDKICVNITDVDFTGAPWQAPFGTKGWFHNGDNISIGTMSMANVAPGDYLIATLTVECLDGDCDCSSILGFDKVRPEDTQVYNVKVTCGDPGPDRICLGDCVNAAGEVTPNMNCSECLNGDGVTWRNYPCTTNDYGCTCDSMEHTVCPECCDGIDNDGVDGTDMDDPKCGCCIDDNETDGDDPCPPPCIPELSTISLMSIGILGMLLLVRKRG